MATIDDVQIGVQITAMAEDGRSCTLTTDDDGPAAPNVRVNQQNGVRNRPYRTADAIAVRNGNLFEVLQFTEYGVVDALRPLDPGETQVFSTGPTPNQIRVKDSGIDLGTVATFNEATKQTTLGGKLVGLGDAQFGGDISYDHDLPNGAVPTVAAWFVAANPVPPTVTGHDAGFKVTFANPGQAIPTGTPIAVITFHRAYATAPVAIGACTSGPGEAGKLGVVATAANVTLTWKDSTAITIGATSEFTVLVRGI